MSDMRKHFESWALGQGWSVDRTDEGDYRTMTTDAAWGAWIACTQDTEERITRICKEWANICESGKRHGAKVGAQECVKLIKTWRVANEA